MKGYEVHDGVRCHIFYDADSYDELLAGIRNWWARLKDDTKTIESIKTSIDDDGTFGATVFWLVLTPDRKKKLEAIANNQFRWPEVEPEIMSPN